MSKYLKSIVAAVLVSLWATAQAQCIPQNAPGPPRYWDGSRGCYVVQGTPAVNSGMVYAPQPMYVQPQYYGGVQRPVYVQPQYYGGMPQQYYGAPQGGLSTGAVVGGILGGTIGSLAKHHTGQAVIGGTILGGIIGNLFSSNGGQRVITQPAPVYNQPQEIYRGPTIPAEQQVGGTTILTKTVVRETSDCDIGNDPSLQNLPVSPAQCRAIREGMRTTKPGHCRVGGVDYPELVDNEPGCLAKRDEVTAQANTKVTAQQQATSAQTTGVWGYMPPGATPSNPKTCYVTVPVSGTRPGCSNIVVLSPQPGETRGTWEQRAARGETFSN